MVITICLDWTNGNELMLYFILTEKKLLKLYKGYKPKPHVCVLNFLNFYLRE